MPHGSIFICFHKYLVLGHVFPGKPLWCTQTAFLYFRQQQAGFVWNKQRKSWVFTMNCSGLYYKAEKGKKKKLTHDGINRKSKRKDFAPLVAQFNCQVTSGKCKNATELMTAYY